MQHSVLQSHIYCDIPLAFSVIPPPPPYVHGYILADPAFRTILPTVEVSHHDCFQQFITLSDNNCSTYIFHAKSLFQTEVFEEFLQKCINYFEEQKWVTI